MINHLTHLHFHSLPVRLSKSEAGSYSGTNLSSDGQHSLINAS
jgi:hypothetical protein